MEMASYLAGEKWSDHPSCTHPLLAELARDVNDVVSDAARQRLAPMIPDVVGLYPTDPRVDPLLARLCALAALPVSSAGTQRVIAVGLMRCETMLAPATQRPGELSPGVAEALADVPHAASWAHQLVDDLGMPADRTDRSFARRTGPAIVRISVRGIAEACITDSEDRLVGLLGDAIDLCRTASPWARRTPTAHPAPDMR